MLSLNPKKCTAFAAACMLSLSIPGFACAATTLASTPSEDSSVATTALPAATPSVPAHLYSVSAAEGSLNFMKNGVQVGSYPMRSSDITLSINSNNHLLVSFVNQNGRTSSVTLGDQRTVQFGGTYNSITAQSSLGGSVSLITDSQSNVSTLTLNAPIETHIYGRAGTVNVEAAADVIVEKGATVTRARMVNNSSMITANGSVKTLEKNTKSLVNGSGVVQTTALTNKSSLASGTSIARSKSGLIVDRGNAYNTSYTTSRSNTSTTSTSGDLRLTASTIYANYRDDLRSLRNDLQNSVRAYDRKTGRRIYGDAYWVSSESTTLTRSGSYRFAFEADNDDYGEVRGNIRIVVDDDDDYYNDRYSNSSSRGSRKYYFEIDKLEVDFDRSERRDYTVGDVIDEDDIDSYVTAYDDNDDDEIDGDYELTSRESSTLGTSISFRFRPDSSRYPVKTGSIKIEFSDD